LENSGKFAKISDRVFAEMMESAERSASFGRVFRLCKCAAMRQKNTRRCMVPKRVFSLFCV